MPKKYIRGFTLVELLITISILAILASIGLISYGNVQRGSRDNKRMADISTIQSALEQYHADQGYYPTSSEFNLAAVTSLFFGTRIYLTKVPTSPTPGTYSYNALPASPCTNTTTNCTNYCLYATLENGPNAVAATKCLGIAPASTTYQTQAP